MVDAAQSIAKVVPTVMAAGLLSHNINYLKKKKKKNLMMLGIDNVVGLGMIQATSQFTNWD